MQYLFTKHILSNVPIAVFASPKYGRQSSEELIPAFEICQKHNVPIIDYYADSLFMQHRNWFKDVMHLNRTGAREYSRIVTAEISNLLKNKGL